MGIIAVALVQTTGAAAAPERSQTAASDVFSAIPGAAVYFQEHRTYVGLTPAFVRRWGGARRVLVRRATSASYCIESAWGT